MGEWWLRALELGWRELALFAGAGFLLLGLSDLAVDLIWIGRTIWRRITVYRRYARADAVTLPPAERPGLLAVFIPAWDEAGVIGAMLTNSLRTFDHADYRLYVGCYPNDPATIAAVRAVANQRVRLVVNPADGPTTKADCLNRLWDALLIDEAAEGRRAKAVVLHDAEDIVHSAELRLFDRLIERFDLVQLPVLPLVDPNSRWIAGHYLDEFAEAHGKELVVREALGAGLPSAGVGCALARERLAEHAVACDGPFDPACLTEDYEIGLRMGANGGRAAFVRLPARAGCPTVVTREYFPATVRAAVSQKARWMTGIALSGWDRLGWDGGFAERWMRLRDRQSIVAALFLAAGYAALLLFTVLQVAAILIGFELRPFDAGLSFLLAANALLLTWRLAMRAGFVTAGHGWREGLRSIPRLVVSNVIAMLAARRALSAYLGSRRHGRVHWDKTAHAFPSVLPAE